MKQEPTRRDFLRRSSETAALLASTAALGGVHAFGAEKPATVSLGIIGCGSIMATHVKRLTKLRNAVSIAWLCDVDPRHIEKTAGLISGSPKTTSKFEDVLADEKVDACIIGTPNHWHTPMALAAMQAGKDVYLEKPATHAYREGALLIAAAKKYNRVFQHGTQMRSSPVTAKAFQLLKNGIIGEIKVARAWTAELRPVISPVPDSEPPPGVDYDRWLGPAPQHAFNELRFHKRFRLFRDYSSGDIGDDGVHDIDLAAHALGVKSFPTRITAHGGRMVPGHASEFSDNMNVTYEYPDGRILIYEAYSTMPYGIHNVDNGNMFCGTEGYMIFSRRGFFNVYLGPKSQPGPNEGKELRGNRGYEEHLADFLTAVRQRTPTRTPADVAHQSCALIHLGDIAVQTRGSLEFDPKSETFRDCDEANQLLTKQYREPYGLPSIS